ncbi:hypothetical protein RM780_00560 [Streptomyces sp. DSM 44917]|uniref:Ig-like domain-containing protein n=1 Tax=Streptomyces boetiae TaxID=3075541 RepID=A0ABU2L1S9_9ACTN|nr:hypothetical protein [Streptomyces sp. DSM 44917]MDT0305457.1 hypothetical protein [Streptomyces sp. DSM 44917]
MAVQIPPRPLNHGEKEVLECILGADFPGSAELRSQVGEAEVVSLWGDGSVSVDLRVPEDTAKADLVSGVAPVEATVVDDTGELVGEILVWVDRGRLAGLEYAWYGADAPTSLPPAENINVLA